MCGFFYFAPRVVNAAEYESLGLGYAFDAPPIVTQLPAAVGPAGNSGTVLHNCPAPTLPKTIEWYRAAEQLWVGHNRHDPPRPAGLRNRTEISAGTAVRLADGQLWKVPRVLVCTDRDPNRMIGLPRIWIGQDGSGAPLTEVPEVYGSLIERAGRFLTAYESTGTGQLPPGEALALVAGLLGVGYRVTAAELLSLGLIDERSAEAICMDAIDALERELSAAPAAITQKLDEAGVVSWAQLVGLREMAEEPTGEFTGGTPVPSPNRQPSIVNRQSNGGG